MSKQSHYLQRQV